MRIYTHDLAELYYLYRLTCCTIENFRKYGASVKLPRLQSRLPLQIVYIVTVVFVIKH